jgi:hypothetical protein
MAFQKKVTTNFGGRIKSTLSGVLLGFSLLAAGTVMLFLNEGNYVKTDKSIREADSALIQVSDISVIDQSLNGKLIHAYGLADTQDLLADSLFGVNERAVGLKREVEYFQYWENTSKETVEKLGGGKEEIVTYTYTQRWTSYPVNSSLFEDPEYKNSNFTLLQLEKKEEQAANVSFGAYKLPSFIISAIGGSQPVNVNLNDEQLIQLYQLINKEQDSRMVHVQGNIIYFGQSSTSPAIGDVRVTLTKIPPAEISIIAKVISNTFERFIASNGRELSMVSMGIVGADTMIARAKAANKTLTWIFRLMGVVLVVVGLKSVLSILSMLFKVIPILGKIVGVGIWIISGVIGGAWSLIIISISWLFYRPLIAIPMLAVAIGGLVFLRIRSKGKKQVEAAAEAVTNEPV